MNGNIIAIVQAWTDPGSHASFHYAQQESLRRHWPALAKALDGLVKDGFKELPVSVAEAARSFNLPIECNHQDNNSKNCSITTYAEAARLLGVTLSGVRAWVRRGALRPPPWDEETLRAVAASDNKTKI